MGGARPAVFIVLLLVVAACGNIADDLNPSGRDKRPLVQAGTTGPAVGQNAPDFTISDSLGNPVVLSSALPAGSVVLYFTMWCSTCDAHMSDMRDSIIPAFPAVVFFAVDYVSGSVVGARDAEMSNGYVGSGFTVLADTAQTVLHLYNASMGTTVVIDGGGVIRMNEDYKSDRLLGVLGGLP